MGHTVNLLTRYTKIKECGWKLTVSTVALRLWFNRVPQGPTQSKQYSKYQLNSCSSKPPFVLPLELATELYFEKNKLQALTLLEVKEEPGKISYVCKENYSKKSFFVMMNQGACL